VIGKAEPRAYGQGVIGKRMIDQPIRASQTRFASSLTRSTNSCPKRIAFRDWPGFCAQDGAHRAMRVPVWAMAQPSTVKTPEIASVQFARTRVFDPVQTGEASH
jgi:hypothetical protein